MATPEISCFFINSQTMAQRFSIIHFPPFSACVLYSFEKNTSPFSDITPCFTNVPPISKAAIFPINQHFYPSCFNASENFFVISCGLVIAPPTTTQLHPNSITRLAFSG